MQAKKPLTWLVTVFAATLFATSTWAAPKEKVLHNFKNNGKDGSFPYAGLIFDASGNLYGTTFYGGSGACALGCGTVFELSPNAGGGWTEKTLHNFNVDGKDGNGPTGRLIPSETRNLLPPGGQKQFLTG